MEVKAHLRGLRMGPKKVRLVLDVVRGMMATDALDQLIYIRKGAARPVRKLLESAVANASHNFHLKQDNLYIKTIYGNQGSTLKRFSPRARGLAYPIRKRSTHITVILDEKGVGNGKQVSGDDTARESEKR